MHSSRPESPAITILFTVTPRLLLYINFLLFIHNMLLNLKGFAPKNGLSVAPIPRQLQQTPSLPLHIFLSPWKQDLTESIPLWHRCLIAPCCIFKYRCLIAPCCIFKYRCLIASCIFKYRCLIAPCCIFKYRCLIAPWCIFNQI